MNKLLTVKEVGTLLGVKPARIYELTRDHKLPHVLLGNRQYRFSEKSLAEWIESGGSRERREVQYAVT
ncbi:hypothetical protein BH18ACI3_BH18ACI3_06890 [soil metagenome]